MEWAVSMNTDPYATRAREGKGERPGASEVWKRRSLGGASATLLLVTLLVPVSVAGQEARSQVQEGNRLYEEGRFEEAHEKYLEALLSDPESPLILFNDGNALYRNQDFQRAMERYREALQSDDARVRGSAWYNLGNALYRQQQLKESLEAYKQALKADPGDADAKYNLERVLQQLQQQEQQQQQPGDRSREGEDPENRSQQDQGRQNPEEQGQDQQRQDQGESQEQEERQNQPGQQAGTEEDQEREPESRQGQAQAPEAQPREGEGEAQARAGEMTEEEAQRLLDAIREDPGEVNRRRAPATGKRPRKDW